MNDQTRHVRGWQVEQDASKAYEEYLVPAIFAPWADRLLEAVRVAEGHRFLDVACGTGIVARQAASRVGRDGAVVALDINEGMLAVAEEIEPTIDWRQGDATALPFSGERFDTICCQQALQFVDDPSEVVEELHRVLSPEGRVALSVWRPINVQPMYRVLAEALEEHIGQEVGEMMRSPFPDWDKDDLHTLVQNAGFDRQSVTIEIGSVRYPSVTECVRREAASSPLAEVITETEPATRDALILECEDALAAYTDDEGIVSPMESYVVTAEK